MKLKELDATGLGNLREVDNFVGKCGTKVNWNILIGQKKNPTKKSSRKFPITDF